MKRNNLMGSKEFHQAARGSDSASEYSKNATASNW
jgi:hypothetical protein